MLQSKALRDIIEIYTENETENDYEAAKTYSLAYKLRAEYTFKSGTESMIGQMSDAMQKVNFKVRWSCSKNINERAFVKFDSRYFNIRAIHRDRNRAFRILETERAPVDTLEIV